MKRLLIFSIAALILAASAAAQSTAAQSDQQSVADVARQLRKQRATTPARRTFTNDDLPRDTVVNVSGAATADVDADKAKSDDTADATKDPASKDAKDTKDKPATDSDTEQKQIAAWQSRLAAQKKEVSDLEHELDIMQREEKLREAQLYWDAGNRLRDDKKWAEEEQKHNDEVADKTAKLQAAREKLDQMKEEARKAGVPSGAIE
jgi:hypothetical protein